MVDEPNTNTDQVNEIDNGEEQESLFIEDPLFDEDALFNDDAPAGQADIYFDTPDSGYAVDPEPSIDHFVDGKRVSGGSWKKMLAGVFLLAICSSGFLLVFRLLKTDSGLPAPDSTAFEKQLSRGRQVVLQTRDLQNYAPCLYRDRVVKGMDLELYDNRRRVSPERYSLEFMNDDLHPVLILNIRGRAPALLAKAKKIFRLLYRMKLFRNGQTIRKQWRLYIRTASRLRRVPLALLARPQRLVRLIRSSARPKAGRKLLLHLIRKLSPQPRHFQIIYLTDRIFGQGEGPDPLSLYRFLKTTRKFRFYRMDLSGTPPSVADQFSYLSRNSGDFRQPASAMCDYRFTGKIEDIFSLFTRQLSLAPPLKRITLIYRPRRPDRPLDKRRLEIRLRLDREDSDLTRLSDTRFSPETYTYLYPSKIPSEKLKLVGGNGILSTRGDFLLRLKDSCTNMQYTAGRIINSLRGRILAVSRNGLFLFRLTGVKRTAEQVVHLLKTPGGSSADVLFITPHPWFRRSWGPVTNGNTMEPVSPWHEDFLRSIPETAVKKQRKTALFLFLPGGTALDDQGLPAQEAVFAGDGAGRFADAAARMMGSLMAAGGLSGCTGIYRVITSTRYSEKYRNRPFVPGFEIYSSLEFLAGITLKRKTVACFDTSGLHPDLWKPHSPDAAKALSKLLLRVGRSNSWIVAPVNNLPSSFTPLKQLLLAAPMRRVQGQSRLLDPSRLSGIGGLQVFPLPGFGILDSKTGQGGSGGAFAAALLLPSVWNATGHFPEGPHHEVVSALQDGTIGNGMIGLQPALRNRGVPSPGSIDLLLRKRNLFRSGRLVLSNLRSNAYRHVSTLLGGRWHEQPGRSMLKALPADIRGPFFRTYQFFDRSRCVTGFPGGNALYDKYTPFHLNREERRELALVAHRGLIFTLCTRNRHRGWILNTGSMLAKKGYAVDTRATLLVMATLRGELLFADIAGGRLLNVIMKDETGRVMKNGTSLKTDHVRDGARLLLDSGRGKIWLYGAGSGFINCISYRRRGNTVRVVYDSRKDCNSRPLYSADKGGRIVSDPVLFPSGTINTIIREKRGKAVYVRIDADGRYF